MAVAVRQRAVGGEGGGTKVGAGGTGEDGARPTLEESVLLCLSYESNYAICDCFELLMRRRLTASNLDLASLPHQDRPCSICSATTVHNTTTILFCSMDTSQASLPQIRCQL